MAKINHLSHGLADIAGHAVPGNIARDGKPKRVHAINVSGMATRAKSGGDALSGHEASGIDATTGNVVVPGQVKSTPGFGNAGIQSGHPLAKAPGAKKLTRLAPAFGSGGHPGLHELGEAVLAEAFRENADAMDCAAHGRNKDGRKC